MLRAFKKYGYAAFYWEILKIVDVRLSLSNIEYGKLLCKYEQFYLNTLLFAQEYVNNNDYRFKKFGYNNAPIAGNNFGVKHTKEARKRMSESHLGYKFTELQLLNHKSALVKATGIKCLLYDLNGIFVGLFDTLSDATKYINIESVQCGHLSMAIKTKSGKCKNFIVKPYVLNFSIKIEPYVCVKNYSEKSLDKLRIRASEIGKIKTIDHKNKIGIANRVPILKIDKNQNVIDEYATCTEVKRYMDSKKFYNSLNNGSYIDNLYRYIRKTDYELLLQQNAA